MKVNEMVHHEGICRHVYTFVDNLKTSWGDTIVIHTISHMCKVLIGKFQNLGISD